MEGKRHQSAAYMASEFVKLYYAILHKCPENLHKYYKESSQQAWPGADGVVTSVTTLSEIHKKIMASDYKYCSVKVETTVAQESFKGGIFTYVTGFLTRKDHVKYHFGQTFFLAKQEKEFFVLHDILRVFYVWESNTEAAQCYVSREACEGHTPLNFKAPIQSGKVAPKSPGHGLPSTGIDSKAKGIYIRGLPYDITKEGIVEVVEQFGPVPRYTKTVQIMRRLDGFCCGFVEFESAESARRAVQARHVMFKEKEAYISYKNRYIKPSRARSPTRRGPNVGVTERDDWVHYIQKPRQLVMVITLRIVILDKFPILLLPCLWNAPFIGVCLKPLTPSLVSIIWNWVYKMSLGEEF